MLAFLTEKNGTDLLSLNNRAIPRLAKKTMEGYEDDSIFELATTVPQDPPDPQDLSWTVVYLYQNRRELSLNKSGKNQANRPYYDAWLGGDLSATFSPSINDSGTLKRAE